MDADAIRALEPALLEFVDRFADCFPRRDTRATCRVTFKDSCPIWSAKAWSRWL